MSAPSLRLLVLLLSLWSGHGAAIYGAASTASSTSSTSTSSQTVAACASWGLPTQSKARWSQNGTRVIYGNLVLVCTNATLVSLSCVLTPALASGATSTATAAANAYCSDYLPTFKPSLKAKQALQKAGCSSLYATNFKQNYFQ